MNYKFLSIYFSEFKGYQPYIMNYEFLTIYHSKFKGNLQYIGHMK